MTSLINVVHHSMINQAWHSFNGVHHSWSTYDVDITIIHCSMLTSMVMIIMSSWCMIMCNDAKMVHSYIEEQLGGYHHSWCYHHSFLIIIKGSIFGPKTEKVENVDFHDFRGQNFPKTWFLMKNDENDRFYVINTKNDENGHFIDFWPFWDG